MGGRLGLTWLELVLGVSSCLPRGRVCGAEIDLASSGSSDPCRMLVQNNGPIPRWTLRLGCQPCEGPPYQTHSRQREMSHSLSREHELFSESMVPLRDHISRDLPNLDCSS